MEQSDKKLLLLGALAVAAILALGLYMLLRNRAAPPPAAPPNAVPPLEQPLSAENKMQILQGLASESIPAAKRKSILDAIMK